jgi:tetratricopeptide (TPR) repeat protein
MAVSTPAPVETATVAPPPPVAPVAEPAPAPPPEPPPAALPSPDLIKAQALVEGGAYRKALEALEPLLAAEPASAEALALRDRAQSALDAEAASRRKRANATRAEARALHEKGKFDLAIERWKEVLEIEPGNAEAKRGIESARREKAALWEQAQGAEPVIEREGATR